MGCRLGCQNRRWCIRDFSRAHRASVRAAKSRHLDLLSGGRFGLNIVAGWNERKSHVWRPAEGMMSVRRGDDWISCVKTVDRQGEFDYEGPHFTSTGCYSGQNPFSVHSPRS